MLSRYCFRDLKETTLGEVRGLYNCYPYHIKPLKDVKLFTGFVVNNNYNDLRRIKNLPDNTEILFSEFLKIESEFRCFVLNGELIGCKNYGGNFKLLPDFNIVESAIKDFKTQPVAYSLDFGFVSENTDKVKQGQTVLIEINDAISLGTYGFDRYLYCQMIEARWKEIIKDYI